jgi:hypothetical protein
MATVSNKEAKKVAKKGSSLAAAGAEIAAQPAKLPIKKASGLMKTVLDT